MFNIGWSGVGIKETRDILQCEFKKFCLTQFVLFVFFCFLDINIMSRPEHSMSCSDLLSG